MATTNWLDQFHDAMSDLSEASTWLNHYATAFDTVGNGVMADRLSNLSYRINAAKEQAQSAVSKNLTDQVADGDKAFGTVLMAIMGRVKEGEEVIETTTS